MSPMEDAEQAIFTPPKTIKSILRNNNDSSRSLLSSSSSHSGSSSTARFSTTIEQVRMIPNLRDYDDEVMDNLFYNDEEIANFRNDAFMEECGLDVADYADYY